MLTTGTKGLRDDAGWPLDLRLAAAAAAATAAVAGFFLEGVGEGELAAGQAAVVSATAAAGVRERRREVAPARLQQNIGGRVLEHHSEEPRISRVNLLKTRSA